MTSFLFIINKPTYNIILDYFKAISYKNNFTNKNSNLIFVSKKYTPKFNNIIIDINKINPDVIANFRCILNKDNSINIKSANMKK